MHSDKYKHAVYLFIKIREIDVDISEIWENISTFALWNQWARIVSVNNTDVDGWLKGLIYQEICRLYL